MGESSVRPSSLPPATRCQPSIYESSGLPPVMFSSCLPPVPAKLVQRIQDGLFIEMGELSSDRLDSPDYFTNERSTNNHSKVPEVTSIMEWVQCFSIFIAVVHSSQPGRTPALIGYQNLIMRTSMLGQEGRWILYDRCFRLNASALRLQHWSTIDITWPFLSYPQGVFPYPNGKLTDPPKEPQPPIVPYV